MKKKEKGHCVSVCMGVCLCVCCQTRAAVLARSAEGGKADSFD